MTIRTITAKALIVAALLASLIGLTAGTASARPDKCALLQGVMDTATSNMAFWVREGNHYWYDYWRGEYTYYARLSSNAGCGG